jgi:hypothetical protein
MFSFQDVTNISPKGAVELHTILKIDASCTSEPFLMTPIFPYLDGGFLDILGYFLYDLGVILTEF